jgi:hypothetical protein
MPNLSTKPILEFSTAADPPPHPLFLSPKSSARFSRNEINKSIPSIDPTSSENEEKKKQPENQLNSLAETSLPLPQP